MTDIVERLRPIPHGSQCRIENCVRCEAAAEIERLRDLFRMAVRNCERYEERLSETEERLEQAARDSARYRWLVNCNDAGVWSFLSGMDDDQIDEEIDRWMADKDSAIPSSEP